MSDRKSVLRVFLCVLVSVVGTMWVWGPLAEENLGWFAVEYGGLVDGRIPTHSGESVSTVLARLAQDSAVGSPARTDLQLLDPLLEPYAFVLPDAVDHLQGSPEHPMVEIGWLWEPGEEGPAWVEVLRARHLLAESDGHGSLRFFLPVTDETALGRDSSRAARAAWDDAWSILRHVVAAEQRRLGQGADGSPSIDVTVYPYIHQLAATRFELGLVPYHTQVKDTAPRGDRPPLDLSEWSRFFSRGLRLEGAVLDGEQIRLIGSETATHPALLSAPVSLADMAVAYRAVFHGGRTEPYMSLDRGLSPQRSVVNYGGRLQDTALGLVTLLCDIRFKTFSLGIDPLTLADVREQVRSTVPGFESHLERFSRNPRSKEVLSQQTRLWFYPDDVDVVLAPEGDVLVMRKVRMTAASERVDEATWSASGQKDPVWTRDLIGEINRDYPGLGKHFDELESLDETVRLLTLFSWLKMLETRGYPLPELDVLLTVPLPALRTPRSFPQMLAFNALPGAGVSEGVEVFQRADIVSALDRLAPRSGRPLPASQRFTRAVDGLDSRDPRHVALRTELQAMQAQQLSDAQLDQLAYRAERMRMHQLVLTTLPMDHRQGLIDRKRSGEDLRVFSVGIGGLDLGMDEVLERAGGRRISLGWGGPAAVSSGQSGNQPRATTPRSAAKGPAAAARSPREQWKKDKPGVPQISLPAHGSQSEPSAGRGPLVSSQTAQGDRWQQVIHGPNSPEMRARRGQLDSQGKLASVIRVEAGRALQYQPSRQGRVVRMDRSTASAPSSSASIPETLAPGLAGLELVPVAPTAGSRAATTIRIKSGTSPAVESTVPAMVVERLLLGHAVDTGPPVKLPVFDTALPVLGSSEALMVFQPPGDKQQPWREAGSAIDPLVDPVIVGRALADWWAGQGSSQGFPAVVVGTNGARSSQRWQRAPVGVTKALWLIPEQALAGVRPQTRKALEKIWAGAGSASSLAGRDEKVVVLVSAEAPGRVAARARSLAADPAMKGRMLVICSLSGSLRADLPYGLLDSGSLAGVGVLETRPLAHAGLAEILGAYHRGLAAAGKRSRPESVNGPFTWYY